MKSLPKTQTVSPEELAIILAGVKTPRFISFSSLTDTKARKTGNPFGEIRKLSLNSAIIGFNYENSVNNQLEREGSQLSFTAKERSWGEKVSPALVKNDKGEFYLVAKIEKSLRSPLFLVRSAIGALMPIERDRISQFLPASRKPTNQGTEKPIFYRTYSFSSLVSLTMDRIRYRIRRQVA